MSKETPIESLPSGAIGGAGGLPRENSGNNNSQGGRHFCDTEELLNCALTASKTPEVLVPGWHWSEIDLNNYDHAVEMANFLTRRERIVSYGSIFTARYMKWLLQLPGYYPEWIFAVRTDDSDQLVACAAILPTKLNIWDTTFEAAQLMFFAIDSTEIMSQTLFETVFAETNRRINVKGISHIIFGINSPLESDMLSLCQYQFRALNTEKMYYINLFNHQPEKTLQETIAENLLPEKPLNPRFRRIRAEDMREAYDLFKMYMRQYWLYPMFTFEQFAHTFTPRRNVIDCYVITDRAGHITDLTSYIYLQISVPNDPVITSVQNIMLFYNIQMKTPMPDLIKDTLIAARNNHVDAVFGLDIMRNNSYFEELNFKKIDYAKYCYIQNCECPFVDPAKMGMYFL